MSDLIVVTRPPGVGKGTVARAFVGLFALSALVLGDDFFAMIDQVFGMVSDRKLVWSVEPAT